MKQRLITGFKPTGDIHIGNYLGAMKDLPKYEKDYEPFIFIADYHALTSVKNKLELKKMTIEIAKALIAIGLNPKKTVIFKQSDVPEVCELAWIFNTLMPMPLLERAHSYKDAREKNKSINVGVFDYPVLMASDILIYNSSVVPVGKDQKQHIEITRTLSQKFNNTYGDTFVTPKEIIKKEVETISGLDGRKMSKSYKNVIGLFESEKSTTKRVMSIVTDSSRPDDPKNPSKCNIFALHRHFSAGQLKDIEKRYKKGDISYKESKEILAENINNELREMRNRKSELDKDEKYVKEVLKNGVEKARGIAIKTIRKVRKRVGIGV